MNIYVMHKIEKDIIRVSSYIEQFDCGLFDDDYDDIRCVVELKDNQFNIYYNELYLFLYKRPREIYIYITNLKQRYFGGLSKEDIRYIYLYKYISVILISVAYFFIWEMCTSICINANNLLSAIVTMLFTAFVIAIVYLMLDFVCSIALIMELKKRNLDFFISQF